MEPLSIYPTAEAAESRVVAVIDIGATSVRMMIAEVYSDGTCSELESLSQAVQLGRDSFITGEISRGTIEDCVHVLSIYRQKLHEYGIDRPQEVRVVATSAVREAENRLAFQDRIYIATGFAIEPFDEASLHLATFLGIQPILSQHPQFHQGQTIVCEVGGGTTEVLTIEEGQVAFAKTYRLGALRLIKTMEALRAPMLRSRDLMVSQIGQTASIINRAINDVQQRQFVVMGGDMRLAASRILGSNNELLVPIRVDQLEAFTHQAMQSTPDALVKQYQLSINEAESLTPALMTNLQLARSFGVSELHVAQVNLRDGLIRELLFGDQWFAHAEKHVNDSALSLGEQFNFDRDHALQVARLCDQLFDETRELHQLTQRWQLLLRVAAILHEVGLAINERSYHKHSMYIIRNSTFFGLSSRDLDLVSQIARYHRRAMPQPRHDAYARLNRDHRANISKLAAILRVAKALDASRTQRIREIQCEVTGRHLRIFVPGITDVSLEQLELQREKSFFERIYGISPDLTLVPMHT